MYITLLFTVRFVASCTSVNHLFLYIPQNLLSPFLYKQQTATCIHNISYSKTKQYLCIALASA